MKAIRAVLDFLVQGKVKYIFGIPAGSVNALFDELYDMPRITPIITKHEGAASYMAAAYAKYSHQLGVCVGCSGPGSTNLLSGAANAKREKQPLLFLTGSVPLSTMGLNASQELDASPIFKTVTKYSVTVKKAEDLLKEVTKAVQIALSGIPGPVHVAIPIDIQLAEIPPPLMSPFPTQELMFPNHSLLNRLSEELLQHKQGIIFLGQGSRIAVYEATRLAEKLNWPIITTPQAKGMIPSSHPLSRGVYGFAGHEKATDVLNNPSYTALLIIGSSLGETATSNWNQMLTKNKYTFQIDIDESVFNKKYSIDFPLVGDAYLSLQYINNKLVEHEACSNHSFSETHYISTDTKQYPEYNTKNVLLYLQKCLPTSSRYTVDIGEFMSYVIHYLPTHDFDSFDINVHFGAMGSGISSAIGSKLADPERPVACITGDGCFFMHGMEILTAKEYELSILFIVMNNARLGMVYHGHSLQYKRSHPRFEQRPINLTKLCESIGIPSLRIENLEDLKKKEILSLLNHKGPTVVEVSLVDNNIPPMGDRVKFLSSFQK